MHRGYCTRNPPARSPRRGQSDRRASRKSWTFGRCVAVESKDPLAFLPRENTLLTTIGSHLATAIDQLSRETDDAPMNRIRSADAIPASRSGVKRRFTFFQKDDCICVDGDYLIRNVPARILSALAEAVS